MVMLIVLASLSAIINRVRPMMVFRVAKDLNAPEKAMKKHHLITERLQSLQYDMLESATDQLGRQFWLMNRIAL